MFAKLFKDNAGYILTIIVSTHHRIERMEAGEGLSAYALEPP